MKIKVESTLNYTLVPSKVTLYIINDKSACVTERDISVDKIVSYKKDLYLMRFGKYKIIVDSDMRQVITGNTKAFFDWDEAKAMARKKHLLYLLSSIEKYKAKLAKLESEVSKYAS